MRPKPPSSPAGEAPRRRGRPLHCWTAYKLTERAREAAEMIARRSAGAS